MEIAETWKKLVSREGGRIVYPVLVLDGVGELPLRKDGEPNFRLQGLPIWSGSPLQSEGVLEIVGPAITPESGPGHLALFGYDPIEFTMSRKTYQVRKLLFLL